MNRTRFAWMGWVILPGLVACGQDETVTSAAIRTQGIYAALDAISIGNGQTSIRADLRVGGRDGTRIVLMPPDTLTASAGTLSTTLVAAGDSYDGALPVDGGGTAITIAFTRGESDEGAPSSQAVLPNPFGAALAGASRAIPRGQPVEVSLTGNIAGALRWSIDGECLFEREGESATQGRLTIAAEDVRVAFRGDTCEAQIVIDSVTTGTIDPAFGEGGRFSAIQRRVVAFTSTPGPDEPGGAPAPAPEPQPDAGAPVDTGETGSDAGSVAPDAGDAG